MPEPGENEGWLVLQIEDDEDVIETTQELIEGLPFGGPWRYLGASRFDDQIARLAALQADMIILDVFEGSPKDEQDRGVEILEEVQAACTAPIVLYTALPEHVKGLESPFVRIVNKDEGIAALEESIRSLYDDHIPQLHKALRITVAGATSKYLWKFAATHWDQLAPLNQTLDFLYMNLRRLALELTSNDGLALAAEIYGLKVEGDLSSGNVPAAAFYLKPPIGQDPCLGDVRLRTDGSFVVVVQPTCDMVRRPKPGHPELLPPACTEVLCARASPAAEDANFMSGIEQLQGKKGDAAGLARVMGNNAASRHFLPGAWEFPDLMVDFRRLEVVDHDELLKKTECLATLAPPFAEALASRFASFIGRIGTPDLDTAPLIKKYEKAEEKG